MKLSTLYVMAAITIATIGCSSGPDCRTCTGTVTNTSEMGDFTVCFEDDVLTQTNNITKEVMTTSNTLPESVAFLESIGLVCEN